MLVDLSFLEPIFSALIESGSGHWLSNREARKNFENDVRLFLEKQKRDTALDVFFFANRPDIRQEHEFLRLEDIYIPLRLRQTRESVPDREEFLRHFDPKTAKDRKAPELPDDLNIIDLLNKMNGGHEHSKILLIGNGGSGKSTFMKYMARFFSEQNERKVRILTTAKNTEELKEKKTKINNQYFPIFIRLRDLEQILRTHNSPHWEDNFNLGHFLQYKHGLNFVTEQFYTKVLQQLPCLILLDGVDEVSEYKDCGNGLIISRRKIMNWIDAQVQIFGNTHPKTSFVLTSRPADLSMLGRSFQVYELNNFSKGEIKLFSEYWYTAYEKTLHHCARTEINATRKDSFLRKIELLPENKASFLKNLDNPHLTELINNPLLLSQAILIHSIDETFELSDVDSLYEKFIETLLYRWDDVRQMNFYPELLGTRNLQRLFQLMGRIAFAFSKREVTKMKVEELLPEVVKAVSRFKNTLPAPNKIIELCTELLGMLRDRGGIFTGGLIAEEDFMQTEFEFQHKSIQDYLTAYTLASDHSLLDSDGFSLYDKIDKREFWGRTLEFFVNLKKGNPDFFFRSYIERIEPETVYAINVHHFTYYFLIAQEKDENLEILLIEKCNNILLTTYNYKEIHIMCACLNKFSFEFSQQHKQLVLSTDFTLLGNYRKTKLAQLYWCKRQYLEITAPIREAIIEPQLEVENGQCYYFRNILLLGLLEKDYKIWSCAMASIISDDKIVKLYYALAFQAILDLITLLEFHEWLSFWDIANLLGLADLQDLQDLPTLSRIEISKNVWKILNDLRRIDNGLRRTDNLNDDRFGNILNDDRFGNIQVIRGYLNSKDDYLRDLRSLRELKDLRDLWDLWDLSDSERQLQDSCQQFIASDNYLKLLAVMEKISQRFQSLTLEQKHKYFKYVDE